MKPVKTHKIETFKCCVCNKRLKRHKIPGKKFYQTVLHAGENHSLESWDQNTITYIIYGPNNFSCEINSYHNKLYLSKVNGRHIFHSNDFESWSIMDVVEFVKNDLILK